ncbi:MAG TPA: VOC family protein [Streptosporangiaceae bacterium]|jgi:catechol 2,3-dioxygenase-like lactoylglutathione lyase family enzyme|nr:VOC family protein [Streptosporangiaceae bacterium]
MMLDRSAVIAFAAATDLDRAREFYQGTLGLTLVDQNPIACVFDVCGTMLRVTAVAQVATPGYTILGWRVDDIDGTLAGLRARGVSFTRYEQLGQDDNSIWMAPNGDRIAWFTDPDGNTLSLTEFAT